MNNQITVEMLSSVLGEFKETDWVVHQNTQSNIKNALKCISLYEGCNSGWYDPRPCVIPNIDGVFIINQDNSICFSTRVKKISEEQFEIVSLTNDAYSKIERMLCDLLNVL